jgi:hypothetical protein
LAQNERRGARQRSESLGGKKGHGVGGVSLAVVAFQAQ